MSEEHEHDSTECGNQARQLREAQEDFQGKLESLARHVEGIRVGTNPMHAQSEGVAALVMDVDDLKRKATRFQDSLDRDRNVIGTLVPLREKVQH